MTRRETATVLHALRVFQAEQKGRRECVACRHFDGIKPLDPKEIDALCERLNTEGR